MKRFLIYAMLILLLLFSFSACSDTTQEEELTVLSVSAAASLTDALTDIAALFEPEHNVKIEFNFGSSGSLKTQILEGAPCDVFISASKSHMDALEEEGLLVEGTREDLIRNTLTLIASSEKMNDITLANLSEADSIAIGEPESVPAGQYAFDALTSLGLWDSLESKVIYAKDVRAVLEYVDSGNVDCGVVYLTDAVLLKTGAVVENFPADSHKPIVYPVAALNEGDNQEMAVAFLEFIKTDEAKAILESYSFDVI